jgi:hypothetical protein
MLILNLSENIKVVQNQDTLEEEKEWNIRAHQRPRLIINLYSRKIVVLHTLST